MKVFFLSENQVKKTAFKFAAWLESNGFYAESDTTVKSQQQDINCSIELAYNAFISGLKIKVCDTCLGTGWVETKRLYCCNGTDCSCNGALESVHCNNCNGDKICTLK